MKQNRTHQLLVYFVLIYTVKHKHRERTAVLLDVSKKVGLEVHTEKTKYMVISRHHNAGQNNVMISNKSFEK